MICGLQAAQAPRSHFQSKTVYVVAVVFAAISFASTLASAIWSGILHYQSSKRCRIPIALSDYSNKYTCTRELAACVMLPVIRKSDDEVKRRACAETVRP
jgi:hypothetical protein